MFNNNTPYNRPDLKTYYKNFYNQNKLSVYLMVASLIALIIGKESILGIFYYIYLIYFGGFIIKQIHGEQKVLTTYLYSGIAGIIILAIAFTKILISPIALTAFVGSASLGLLTAAATSAPNMEIMLVLFGRTKIKWIAIILIAIQFISSLNPDGLNNLCNLGGIAFGFLSIRIAQYGKINIRNPFSSFFKKRGPYYDPTKKYHQTRRENDDEYRKRKAIEQKEIDAILEKIKLKGYESLTAEEKSKLFDKSQNDN